MLRTRFIGLTHICKSASTQWQHRIAAARTYIRPHYYSNNEPLSKAVQAQKSPLQRFSRKMNNMDPNKVLWSVIGTNVGVYLLWQYAINSYKQFGDAHWLNIMRKHFISSPEAMHNGRYHTLLTSAFSHKSLDHLGLNMLVLYSIGQGVIEAIGASRFLILYAGAGITASLVAVGYRKYIRPLLEKEKYGRSGDPRLMGGSMGASGSVMAITSFFACAYPRATFLVFFIVPMPAIAVVGLFAAYDIYQASTLEGGIVDSAAHIGGVAYGAGYWFLRVRPMLRAGRWRV
ncbi:hypothetical protein V8B55DRAFT_1454116 [Mucor lusitanicus]